MFGDASLEGLMERIEQRKSVAAFESYQKVLDAGTISHTLLIYVLEYNNVSLIINSSLK